MISHPVSPLILASMYDQTILHGVPYCKALTIDDTLAATCMRSLGPCPHVARNYIDFLMLTLSTAGNPIGFNAVLKAQQNNESA